MLQIARPRSAASDWGGGSGGGNSEAPPRWPCPLTGSPDRRVGGAFQVLCLTSRVGCVERAMWEGLRPPQPDSETPPSSQHTNFILCRTFKSRYHSQPALLRPAPRAGRRAEQTMTRERCWERARAWPQQQQWQHWHVSCSGKVRLLRQGAGSWQGLASSPSGRGLRGLTAQSRAGFEWVKCFRE